MDGFDLDLQRLNQAGQPGCLAARQVEHQAAECRGVDDRVLKGPGKAATQDPGVEGVVAVLDQDASPGEVEEGPPGVAELRRVDKHVALDQVASLRVGVDRRPGVDKGVEEAQRPAEPEALGADLEDQERTVAGGLDVHGDELGLLQPRLGADREDLFADFYWFPGDQLGRAAGLEPQRSLGAFSHRPMVGRSPPPPRLRRESPWMGEARLASLDGEVSRASPFMGR